MDEPSKIIFLIENSPNGGYTYSILGTIVSPNEILLKWILILSVDQGAVDVKYPYGSLLLHHLILLCIIISDLVLCTMSPYCYVMLLCYHCSSSTQVLLASSTSRITASSPVATGRISKRRPNFSWRRRDAFAMCWILSLVLGGSEGLS